ncbi:hypothetical protein PSET11_01716 [Arthrobacter ulcerisalmonis]|uniref:Lipoprotein n=2 Tax=Arthrobacter ulcerisalmonis TaxID=2483813 RepID=A0A3P5X5J0_9MICC|nr:hypothetical protein PSET11_01716 [Arthrobacter ulcerisalmonis]
MRRFTTVCLAIMVALGLAGCRPSIDDIARSAIRDQATEALPWFTHVVSTNDTSDRILMATKMNAGGAHVYDFGWEEDVFYADLYFEEHVTTSGGLFGEQRTVNACVRYTDQPEGPVTASIDCPDRAPYNRTVDEHVPIP